MNNFYEETKSLPITCDDGLVRPPWAATDPLLRTYYDTEWGMPLFDEASLFERLCLEGFQVGLSWRLILSKREAFREAFFGFDPDKVAAMESIDHRVNTPSKLARPVPKTTSENSAAASTKVYSMPPSATKKPLPRCTK